MQTATPLLTRKQQVLRRLERTPNIWINGSELATEQVGGSEGQRRIRELRAAGLPIEKRVNPAGPRFGYQYRIVRAERREPPEVWICETCGTQSAGRPQVIGGGLGIGKCGTCRSRRYFKSV